MEDLLKAAKSRTRTVTEYRRQLHRIAECGFDLPKTFKFVKETLQKMGYHPKEYGKGGIVCEVKGRAESTVLLLRADMDALPIKEKTALPFRAQNGCMHACGHDMHTAMLLLAAELLKEREARLSSSVRFVFQAAEETLSGAKVLCDAGILTDVFAALMLHVIPATHMETGTVFVPCPGIGAPAARFFSLSLRGESAHVGDHRLGKDALAEGIALYLAMEAEAKKQGADLSLTVGRFTAGDAPNIVAENAVLSGSFRSRKEESVLSFAQTLEKLAKCPSVAAKTHTHLTFLGGCPPLRNDGRITAAVKTALTKQGIPHLTPEGESGNAAEDFAHIAQAVPAAALGIAAGRGEDGYRAPLHHPEVLFDEEVLPIGAAVLTASALTLSEDRSLQTFTKSDGA